VAEVTLENVGKVYPGGVAAVRNFDLHVPDGRLAVILGPSGCGKSTILRMVAGLEEVTCGTISIGAKAVNHVAPKDRDVAMVFQDYALYPHMTVRRNMGFGLKMRKFPKAEILARVQYAAGLLGLENLLDRRPGSLSGGQRQRVALGRAIVRRPAVFLFDEPLSNLDAALRSRTRVEIKRLHARLGGTMLYVTHDQVEAMTLGRQIVVIKEGTVQQSGDPPALYNSPANRFVAGFIGAPSMNFFEGSIRRRDDRLIFAAKSGFVLPAPPSARSVLSPYENSPITLGVRGEHFRRPTAGRSRQGPPIAARVELVEPLGAATHVHLNAGGDRFVIRAEPHEQFQPGKEISVTVPAEKMHFFDPKTEVCLTSPLPVTRPGTGG